MYYQNERDETLVLLTLAGDQAAYEKLVVRYQTAVVASAASITRNHSLAEDAAQDAFVTAWMKLNTLQEPQKFGAWVCRIAKNCAINMIHRYREFLPLDVVDNLDLDADRSENPATLYAVSEERREIRESVNALPEKVQAIIRMHYFEGLSVTEIADKLCLSEGTVKWQLHDGRKRIRKELCAMNEKYSDTLVQKVMKKVEELKLWQMRNDKSGFEKVYRDVLREVEELPESKEKQHALADVLMRGWWWIPGKKNNELMKRIANAAIEGKNEEVMSFIVGREDDAVWGAAKIEFIRDKQIPKLQAAGFREALAQEWLWLGYNCFRDGKTEEGKDAYDQAEKISAHGEKVHAILPHLRRMEDTFLASFQEKNESRYLICAKTSEIRTIDGELRHWKDYGYYKGYINSVDQDSGFIFRNSCRCDGYFFRPMAVGEHFVGSDGSILAYVSDSETVKTPISIFENCQLWVTTYWNDAVKFVSRSYYKEGVGIVRYEHSFDGVTEARILKSYEIKGGSGYLPLAEGNKWEYTSEYDLEAIRSDLQITVSFADEKKMLVSSFYTIERLKYDKNSWLDTIQEIRNEYHDGHNHIQDITPAIDRVEALAKTPMEKAHAKAAVSVARRILSTDTTFNPNYTAMGLWNFFSKNAIRKKNDTLIISHHYRWSFEWKNTGGGGNSEDSVLYNDIFGILQDATNCIWSDEWRIGTAPLVEYIKYDHSLKTQITCEDGGTITTKAGTFENCFKLCMDIHGMKGGLSYRGGKKTYYFAEGIGIVRTENEYCGGARTAVYELTSYEGVGEGFMPMADGLIRRYDAIDMTDGYVGSAVYTYVANDDGDIVIFADRTGIREVQSPITHYGDIQNEQLEEVLWNKRERTEAHELHALNNAHLMLHYLSRPSWNRGNPDRSIGMCEFKRNLMKLLGDGEVPPAWYNLYAWISLIQSAALFGKGEKERGYASLDDAVEYYRKGSNISVGEELALGNPIEFGNVKYIKGKGHFLCPSGKKDPVNYEYRLEYSADNLHYALTAKSGWEWFNSVRNEDLFKEYVEKAQALKDEEDDE